VIAGAGDIGRQLVHTLSENGRDQLVVIDEDEAKCEALAGEFDLLVIHGDATDPEMLTKAQIREADALVATTESDAINTVIAMLGHRFGVEKIIVKLNGFGLRAACREIGVSEIVAPKIAAAARIKSALQGAKSIDFSLVVQGGLKLLELEAGAVKGQAIRELHLPEGALFVALLRGDKMLIPRGGTHLEADDVLLTLVETEGVLRKVRRVLGLEENGR
jgi:trk system potassium uptake protein TrkA